ncbi:dephospho-CoA kinase [Rhizobium sp. Root274]|uniref:dephospho-CoA kinase n=1 Tax=unclassified Rhizobium TaxID=2613769 RepID=UPI000713FD3A|nr:MULTISPECIES: dephospho-CoA kinase [unclassified Rhizobium]KQW27825.1 dephospho-CoA kinase [Rhizobium sp. Root1240]KRD28106.1 dephospho-CoA kinase [Rhizobium sp. Root274]
MIVIGLTGSIGMGKTTTAGLFAAEGIAVHDADAAVHDLYSGEAVAPIASVFPEVVVQGQVDRRLLSGNLAKNPANFKRLEAIVHPLVRQRENKFLGQQRQSGAEFAVLDIPLLFETGADQRVDVKVVASCDEEIQRRRVLARPGMTEEKLDLILSRQVPDVEKRARADFVVDSGVTIEHARRQVQDILATLRQRNSR